VDVYNLILDRGYLGALKYASEIEDKNFRLASEIDQIVSELYRMASGGSGFRYAQSAMPRFDTYRRPSVPQYSPSAPVQNNETDYTPTFSPAPRPDKTPGSEGISAVGSVAGIILKIKGAIESRKIPRTVGDRMIKKLLSNTATDVEVRRLSRLIDTKQWAKANQYLIGAHDAFKKAPQSSRWVGDSARKLKGNIKFEKARFIVKILGDLSTKFPALAEVFQFISKNTKLLGALAIPFDAYDIYTDYQREGLSARVTCKVGSIISGMISLFPGPHQAVFIPLWAALSLGCAFIPQSNKNDDDYKNLNQSEIDKAESTVTLDSLPQSDQNLVRDLFSSKTREELISKLRELRNSRKFEKPIESMALIQRQLASGNGQIVPLG
jgi:hypothetical protein